MNKILLILFAFFTAQSLLSFSAQAQYTDSDHRLCSSRASSGEIYNANTLITAGLPAARKKALAYCQANEADANNCSPAVCLALSVQKSEFRCAVSSPSLRNTTFAESDSESEAAEGAQWLCIQTLPYSQCEKAAVSCSPK